MSATSPYRQEKMFRSAALLGVILWGITTLFMLSGCSSGGAQTQSVSGKITRGSSALAGVQVTLSGSVSLTAITDAAGNFRFSNLPVGAYLLTPTFSGFTFTPASRSVWLNGIDGTAFDFTAYYPNHLAMSDHTMYLDGNANLLGWGNNSDGQLGYAAGASNPLPVQVAGLPAMAAVANGASHTVALAADGTVWTWGSNNHGQLGDGSIIASNIPRQVTSLNLVGITAVAAGSAHSVAVRYDGTVWAWGSNSNGQLGNNTIVDSTTPIQVLGVGGTGFMGVAKGIAAGHDHTVVHALDNTVWAWGSNGNGQLGNNTTTDSHTPIQVTAAGGVVAIAAGDYHTAVLRKEVVDFKVWCWGKNSEGQLGDGTIVDHKTPVEVKDLTKVTTIAAGSNHTVAVLNDGTVRAWGGNGSGQLGNGTVVSSSIPVTVSGLGSVLGIAAGNANTVALSLDNSVWSWGKNDFGQLGDGSITSSDVPVKAALP